jgi:MoaA/NifB/PqqE/SkfB family radical SAM enzyme
VTRKVPFIEPLQTIRQAASYSACHLRQEIDFRVGTLLSTPDRVSIKLTERCNAKCTMCSFWKDSTPPSLEVTLEEWLDFVDQVAGWARPCSFVLTGGEPFVSANAIPVASHAVARGLDVSVHSNGIYFLNETNTARILDTGVRRIIFSIDSHRAELHDRRRGTKGLHERVRRAITTIKRLEPKAHITLSHIILSESASHLCEFLDWAREAGVDSVSLQPLEATFGTVRNDQWHEDSEDFQVDRIAFAQQIDRIQTSAAYRRFLNNDAEDLEHFIRYFEDPNAVSIAEGQCHKGLTDLFVNQFGDVHFCWHYERVGNIRKHRVASIWRDQTARQQRSEIKRCTKPCTGACYRHYSFGDKVGRFLRDRL